MEIIYRLSNKEKSAANCWLTIAVLQIVIGIALSCFGYGFAMIAVGVWNIYASVNRKKFAKSMLANPQGIYHYYKEELPVIILFLCINFFLGGAIGVIGNIYDLCIRGYAMKHETELCSVEAAMSDTII